MKVCAFDVMYEHIRSFVRGIRLSFEHLPGKLMPLLPVAPECCLPKFSRRSFSCYFRQRLPVSPIQRVMSSPPSCGSWNPLSRIHGLHAVNAFWQYLSWTLFHFLTGFVVASTQASPISGEAATAYCIDSEHRFPPAVPLVDACISAGP